MTVLVGKNGSGKSVLLRSWRDSIQDGVHYVAPERTGEMDFQPNYISEEMDYGRRRASSGRNFVQDYRRRIIGRIQSYFMIRGNARGNQPAPGNPDEIEALLSSLLADFDVRLRTGPVPYSLIRTQTNEEISRIDQLSSGEAQLFTIGLDLLTIAAIWEIEQRSPRIVLLDEPDAHIHPDLQARFADFVFRIADRFDLQFVIATHSTSLLSAFAQFGGARTAVVYLDRLKKEYAAVPFSAVMKEIASCLGGHVLMGPLFGAPLLLVEGDDDYRIWSLVPRYHLINVAVIPCNGEEIRKYQLALERILSSLSDPKTRPVGYALLDGDKTVPMPSPDNQQQFIRFIGLGCRESENLYLTDEVLASLGLTWESALAKITAAADSFGQSAARAREAPSWDRRTVDIKDMIGQLGTVLDAKDVLWTTRVGAALGKGRPTGQLEAFLGAKLVEALWSLPFS
ncbi:MAG TPA: AAA family ATPase [Gemmatimonadaceae bacterium]|nr:AAA family ATPase [Gemmatimonadaceae bacterium]